MSFVQRQVLTLARALIGHAKLYRPDHRIGLSLCHQRTGSLGMMSGRFPVAQVRCEPGCGTLRREVSGMAFRHRKVLAITNPCRSLRLARSFGY